MTGTDEPIESSGNDRVLGWTMRIVGLALSILSVVLLTQDIVQGANATFFFSISAGLGILALISSWMPGADRGRLHDERATKYARGVAQ